MKTTRRRFIRQTGGFSLLLGFPSLGCRRVPAPDWLEEGLARMRKQNKPGVVLRVPTEKKKRCLLGHQLAHYMNSRKPDVHEIFCEAVFMCLESATVADHIQGARKSETVILIDVDGYAQAGAPALTLGKPYDEDSFAVTLRSLLHGPGNQRLVARAEALRRKTPVAVVKALDELKTGPDLEILEKHAGSILPLLVRARLEADTKDREAKVRRIIEKHFADANVKKRGPRLPYGVEVRPDMGGCGDRCEEGDPNRGAVACGMAMMVPGSREFVKFLTT